MTKEIKKKESNDRKSEDYIDLGKMFKQAAGEEERFAEFIHSDSLYFNQYCKDRDIEILPNRYQMGLFGKDNGQITVLTGLVRNFNIHKVCKNMAEQPQVVACMGISYKFGNLLYDSLIDVVGKPPFMHDEIMKPVFDLMEELLPKLDKSEE